MDEKDHNTTLKNQGHQIRAVFATAIFSHRYRIKFVKEESSCKDTNQYSILQAKVIVLSTQKIRFSSFHDGKPERPITNHQTCLLHRPVDPYSYC